MVNHITKKKKKDNLPLLDLEITWLLWTKITYHPRNIQKPNFGKFVYEALKMELIFTKKKAVFVSSFTILTSGHTIKFEKMPKAEI